MNAASGPPAPGGAPAPEGTGTPEEIEVRLAAQRDALAATLGQMIPANLVLRLRTDIPQDDQPAKTAACSAMATMNRHKYTPAT